MKLRLGLEPAERHERTVPGELIHIDVKKLGPAHTTPPAQTNGEAERFIRTLLSGWPTAPSTSYT
jgi:hypothetical protein